MSLDTLTDPAIAFDVVEEKPLEMKGTRPMNETTLLDTMKDLAQKIFDSVDQAIPVEMSVCVKMLPGLGAATVQFTARSGDCMGKANTPLEWRCKFGTTPEGVAAELIEAVADADVREKIMRARLEDTAEKLGYRLVKKPSLKVAGKGA